MTYQEAIEVLKLINTSRVHPFYDWGEMSEVRDMAIEALEKEIPKKIFLYGDDEDGIMPCPFCEEDLYDDKECGFNCCPHCGQAIDWEETE